MRFKPEIPFLLLEMPLYGHFILSNIGQKFTRIARPQTNGKAERVIRTIMEMWHDKMIFNSRQYRKDELVRFINFYNSSKPHKGLDNKITFEVLHDFFYSE